MGDPKLTVTDTVFSAGQNEGIERAVLPLPQLKLAQNVRLRKGGRWGKRFGVSSISVNNLSTKNGFTRCLSNGFAIVDAGVFSGDGEQC